MAYKILSDVDILAKLKLGDGTNSIIYSNSVVDNAVGQEITLKPSLSNTNFSLNLRPTGSNVRVPGLVFSDDENAITNSNSFVIGQGSYALDNNIWHIAATVVGVTDTNSLPISFSVSNPTDKRFSALLVNPSGQIDIIKNLTVGVDPVAGNEVGNMDFNDLRYLGTGTLIVSGDAYNLVESGTDLGAFVDERAVYDQAGSNLWFNGSGILQDNTNFPNFTFDPQYAKVGWGGFFTSSFQKAYFSTNKIPVSQNKKYTMSGWVIQPIDVGQRQYLAISYYDIDNNLIDHRNGNLNRGQTTLAVAYVPGDPTITLTDGTNWTAGANSTNSYVHFSPYFNSLGVAYDVYSYSRYISKQNFTLSGNVVTLGTPNDSGLINPNTGDGSWPIGTPIMNTWNGGTYYYPWNAILNNTTWNFISGKFDPATDWRDGTASIKVGFLINYTVTGGSVAWSGLNFSDMHYIKVGTGLDNGLLSGVSTITLDFNELTTGGTLIGSDYLVSVNGTATQKQLVSSIPITAFNTNLDVVFGNITATSFIKTGGLVSEFLKADGSVDSNLYLLDSTGWKTTGTTTVTSPIILGNTTFNGTTTFEAPKRSNLKLTNFQESGVNRIAAMSVPNDHSFEVGSTESIGTEGGAKIQFRGLTYTSLPSSMSIITKNIVRIYIDSAGDIAIGQGVVIPKALLDVGGTGLFSGTLDVATSPTLDTHVGNRLYNDLRYSPIANTGSTNLGYTPGISNGTVTSDTGTNAIIPLADVTNAGLIDAAEKLRISNSIQGTSTLNEILIGDTIANSAISSSALTFDGGEFSINITGSDKTLNAFTYYNDAILRSYLTGYGHQVWIMRDDNGEMGKIVYSSPGGEPGIVFYNASSTGRSQIKLNSSSGGLAFGANTSSSNPADSLLVGTDGNITVYNKLIVIGDPTVTTHVGNQAYNDLRYQAIGSADMLKAIYDIDNSGVVDNSELVNGLTVLTAVPAGALFTDTVYDDTILSDRVTVNEGDITNLENIKLEWKGEWVETLYKKNVWVKHEGRLYVSNVDTTDTEHPLILLTDYAWDYTETPTTIQKTAKNLTLSQRYILENDSSSNFYEINIIAGNIYKIFVVFDPLGVKAIVEKFSTFVALETVAHRLPSLNIIYKAGTVLDVVVIVEEPDVADVVTTIPYNYITPNNTSTPNSGEIRHENKKLDTLRIHKFDDDGIDQSVYLATLLPADNILIGNNSYSISTITDQGTYYNIIVAPAIQYGNDGRLPIDFTAKAESTISHALDLGYYTGNIYRSSFISINNGYDENAVQEDDYIGLNISFRTVLANPEWDDATPSGVGGGSSGGVAVGTNLNYIASPTDGIVTSDTGDDVILPVADSTNAGLITPAEKLRITDAWQASGATTVTNPTITGNVTIVGSTVLDNIEISNTITSRGSDIKFFINSGANNGFRLLPNYSASWNVTATTSFYQFGDASLIFSGWLGVNLTRMGIAVDKGLSIHSGSHASMPDPLALLHVDGTGLFTGILSLNGDPTADSHVGNRIYNDLRYAPLSVSGITNLGFTASPINGILSSSSGTDAIITLANLTDAGLLSPIDKNIIDKAIIGSIATTQIAVGDFSSGAIVGSANLTWDGSAISVIGDGTIAHSFLNDDGIAVGDHDIISFFRFPSGVGNGGMKIGYESDGTDVIYTTFYVPGWAGFKLQTYDGALTTPLQIEGSGEATFLKTVDVATTPTVDTHIGNRLYNDNRYLRSFTEVDPLAWLKTGTTIVTNPIISGNVTFDTPITGIDATTNTHLATLGQVTNFGVDDTYSFIGSATRSGSGTNDNERIMVIITGKDWKIKIKYVTKLISSGVHRNGTDIFLQCREGVITGNSISNGNNQDGVYYIKHRNEGSDVHRIQAYFKSDTTLSANWDVWASTEVGFIPDIITVEDGSLIGVSKSTPYLAFGDKSVIYKEGSVTPTDYASLQTNIIGSSGSTNNLLSKIDSVYLEPVRDASYGISNTFSMWHVTDGNILDNGGTIQTDFLKIATKSRSSQSIVYGIGFSKNTFSPPTLYYESTTISTGLPWKFGGLFIISDPLTATITITGDPTLDTHVGNRLYNDGRYALLGVGGITNLAYIASPTDGIITSDTGADATIPLVDVTNAGLISPSDKTIIDNAITGVATVDQIVVGNTTSNTVTSSSALTYIAGELKIEGNVSSVDYVKLSTNNSTNNGRGVFRIPKLASSADVALWVMPDVASGTYLNGTLEVFNSTDNTDINTKRMAMSREATRGVIFTSSKGGNDIGDKLDFTTLGIAGAAQLTIEVTGELNLPGDPTLDTHVGNRLYNDGRYASSTGNIGGSIANTQIAFGNSNGDITGNNNLTYVSDTFKIINSSNSNFVEFGFPTAAGGEPALSIYTNGIVNGRVLQRQTTTNNVFIGDIDNNGGEVILRAAGTEVLNLGTDGIGTFRNSLVVESSESNDFVINNTDSGSSGYALQRFNAFGSTNEAYFINYGSGSIAYGTFAIKMTKPTGKIVFSVAGSGTPNEQLILDTNGAIINKNLSVLTDPTADTHVGNRLYNDTRYILGLITDTQVAFGNASGDIVGSSDFIFDSTDSSLKINSKNSANYFKISEPTTVDRYTRASFILGTTNGSGLINSRLWVLPDVADGTYVSNGIEVLNGNSITTSLTRRFAMAVDESTGATFRSTSFAGASNGLAISFSTLGTGVAQLILNTTGTLDVAANPTLDTHIGNRLYNDGRYALTGLIGKQENLDVDSAAPEMVAQIATASNDGAFFDYLIKSGTNLQAGRVTAIHDGTNVEYTISSTSDLGDCSDVSLSVDISGGFLRLMATVLTDNWIVKASVIGI